MPDYTFIAPFYDFLLGPFMRSIRREVLDILQRLQPENVLDVACGTGDQLRLLAGNNIDAVGVDMSEAMLKICRRQTIRPPTVSCRMPRTWPFKTGVLIWP